MPIAACSPPTFVLRRVDQVPGRGVTGLASRLNRGGATIVETVSHAFPRTGLTCVPILRELHAALEIPGRRPARSTSISFSCTPRLHSVLAINDLGPALCAAAVDLRCCAPMDTRRATLPASSEHGAPRAFFPAAIARRVWPVRLAAAAMGAGHVLRLMSRLRAAAGAALFGPTSLPDRRDAGVQRHQMPWRCPRRDPRVSGAVADRGRGAGGIALIRR